MRKILPIIEDSQHYCLRGELKPDSLGLSLLIKTTPVRHYTACLTNLNLPPSLKQNFQDISNTWSMLQTPTHYSVDGEGGKITLKNTIKFPNGNTMELQGQVILNQSQTQISQFPPGLVLQRQIEKLVRTEVMKILQIELKKQAQAIALQVRDSSRKESADIILRVDDLQDTVEQIKAFSQESERKLRREVQDLQKKLLASEVRRVELENEVQKLGMKCQILQNKFNQVLEGMEKPKIKEQAIQPKSKEPEYFFLGDRKAEDFCVEDKFVRYLGKERETQILTRIFVTQKTEVSIRIVRSFMGDIGLGIINEEYWDEMYSGYNKKHKHMIWYNGKSGGIFESGKFAGRQGKGFREGDVVTMSIDVDSKSISWLINGEKQSSHRSTTLRVTQVNWVYFILMCERGDTVELCV